MLTPSVASTKELKASAINTASEPLFGGLPTSFNDIKRLNNSQLDNAVSNFLAERRKLSIRKFKLNKQNPLALMEIGNAHFAASRFTKAKDTYLSVLRINETYLPAYVSLVDSFLALGMPDRALQQAERGLKLSNSNIQIWLKKLLCEIILLNDDIHNKQDLRTDEVEADFHEALDKYENNTEAINLYGMFLAISKTDYQKATEQFQINLKLNPKHVDSLNNVGLCYWNLNKPVKAVEYLRKALDVNPKYPNAYSNLISLYALKEDYKNALEVLDSAIKAEIPLADNWELLRAQLLADTGKYQESLDLHLSIYAKNKDSDRFLNNLGFCYENLGDVKNALKFYQKSVNKLLESKMIPLDQPLRQFYNLMILARASNDKDLVQTTARKLMVINPKDTAAYYFLNNEGVGRGNAGFAKQALKKRIELNPDEDDAYATLSFILTSIEKNHDEAIELITNAPKSVQDNIAVYNNLVYAYIQSGQLDKAEAMLKSKSSSTNSHINATRGLLELYKDNFTVAQKLYKKAIEQFTDTTSQSFVKQVWAYERGNYYLNKGELDKAKQFLEEAIELGDSSYAYEDSKTLLESLGFRGRSSEIAEM